VALVGIKPEDVDAIWKDLGTDVGQALALCVHFVQACPGTSVCKFGVQDSLGLGLEMEKLFVGRDLPGKFKLSVSGCPFCCSEGFVRDLGVLGKKSGWTLIFGGHPGAKPRIADIVAEVLTRSSQRTDRINPSFTANAIKARTGRPVRRTRGHRSHQAGRFGLIRCGTSPPAAALTGSSHGHHPARVGIRGRDGCFLRIPINAVSWPPETPSLSATHTARTCPVATNTARATRQKNVPSRQTVRNVYGGREKEGSMNGEHEHHHDHTHEHTHEHEHEHEHPGIGKHTHKHVHVHSHAPGLVMTHSMNRRTCRPRPLPLHPASMATTRTGIPNMLRNPMSKPCLAHLTASQTRTRRIP
jgi:hypothetical protein